MFHKVSDTEAKPLPAKQFNVSTSGGWFAPRSSGKQTSTSTVGHTTWRCNNCRALAVGPIGCAPPTECGKCHSKGGAG
jgi:hypothetical protein